MAAIHLPLTLLLLFAGSVLYLEGAAARSVVPAHQQHIAQAELRHWRHLTESNGTKDGDGDTPQAITGALALYTIFGVYVFASWTVAILGVIAILQWPNVAICCYRTPYVDAPSNEGCGRCCSLHRLNIGFAVSWLGMLVLLVLAFVIFLMVGAAVLIIIHSIVAWRLMRNLRRAHASGAAAAAAAASAEIPTAEMLPISTRASRHRDEERGIAVGVPVPRPLPGVPVPGRAVPDIPLSTALVCSELATHTYFTTPPPGHRAHRPCREPAGSNDGVCGAAPAAHTGPSGGKQQAVAAKGPASRSSCDPAAQTPNGTGGVAEAETAAGATARALPFPTQAANDCGSSRTTTHSSPRGRPSDGVSDGPPPAQGPFGVEPAAAAAAAAVVAIVEEAAAVAGAAPSIAGMATPVQATHEPTQGPGAAIPTRAAAGLVGPPQPPAQPK